jgi:hypothetical protein
MQSYINLLGFKTMYFVLIVVGISISSCRSGISSIDIDDIEKHRKYQIEQIEKGSNYTEKFENAKKLISEYRSIEKKESSKYLEYYISRLYGLYIFDDVSIDSLWFDHANKSFKNQSLYQKYVDSALYYNNIALQKDSNNIYALRNYITNSVEAIQLPLRKKGIYKYYQNKPKELDATINNIIPFTDKILKIDTSKDRSHSFVALQNSIGMLDIQLLGTNNTDLNNINNKNMVQKLENYFNIFNQIKDLCPDKEFVKHITDLHNKYSGLIAEANVTIEEYQNLGCNKLWIYSNGKYVQEIYEMDTESIPYDDRMRLTAYDLNNCNYPGARINLVRKSVGSYVKENNYYYFYSNKDSFYEILAGYDGDKGVYYLKKDASGNFTWINPATFEEMSYTRVR